MSDRKTLKVHPETKARLDDAKRDGETMDGLLSRALDALDAQAWEAGDRNRPSQPLCSECGKPTGTWTIRDGDVLCLDCAGIDPSLAE